MTGIHLEQQSRRLHSIKSFAYLRASPFGSLYMMNFMCPASQGFAFDSNLLVIFQQLSEMGKIDIKVLLFD